MWCQLKCHDCGAVTWVRGTDDPDVGGLELDDSEEWEWEGTMTECYHENHIVIEVEYRDDYFPDDAI